MIINTWLEESAKCNVAENFTQPVDYFEFHDSVKKVDLNGPVNDITKDVSAIILGGSGIFGAQMWNRLKEIVDRAPEALPVVIWGMGINDHHRFDKCYHPNLADLERRKNVLIGLRDGFYKNYVPCVSCMRPEFDAHFEIQYSVGLYVHQNYNIALHYPTMTNRLRGNPLSYFGRVIKFLGSCDTVVTNTYHGAYWATLLGRKVVVVSPFSNKFFGFRYEPVIIPDIRFLASVVNVARVYPDALAESRRLNNEFYRHVLIHQNDHQCGQRIHSGESSTP